MERAAYSLIDVCEVAVWFSAKNRAQRESWPMPMRLLPQSIHCNSEIWDAFTAISGMYRKSPTQHMPEGEQFYDFSWCIYCVYWSAWGNLASKLWLSSNSLWFCTVTHVKWQPLLVGLAWKSSKNYLYFHGGTAKVPTSLHNWCLKTKKCSCIHQPMKVKPLPYTVTKCLAYTGQWYCSTSQQNRDLKNHLFWETMSRIPIMQLMHFYWNLVQKPTKKQVKRILLVSAADMICTAEEIYTLTIHTPPPPQKKKHMFTICHKLLRKISLMWVT